MDIGAVLNPDSENKAPPATSLGGDAKDAGYQDDEGKGSLMQQWNDWLVQPGNQAALITAGLNMMQPISAGQTTLGHIARSIGLGAEAKTEAEKLDIAQESANAENEYRRANAEYLRAGGSRYGRAGRDKSLTDNQRLLQQNRDDKRWATAMEAVFGSDDLGGDSFDWHGAMFQIQRDDPAKYEEMMQQVQQFYDALSHHDTPTLSSAVGGTTKYNAKGESIHWDADKKAWLPGPG